MVAVGIGEEVACPGLGQRRLEESRLADAVAARDHDGARRPPARGLERAANGGQFLASSDDDRAQSSCSAQDSVVHAEPQGAEDGMTFTIQWALLRLCPAAPREPTKYLGRNGIAIRAGGFAGFPLSAARCSVERGRCNPDGSVNATCVVESQVSGTNQVQRIFRAEELPMKYKIALERSDEGFSVSVPGLPGCWSQGATEAEALANIRAAIAEYLVVRDDLLRGAEIREVEVA